MNSTSDAGSDLPTTENDLVRAHALAALAMVVYSVLLGASISLKFHWPDFLGSQAWLTWGRLRYGHTQGIFFGWLGNAFLMFFYHAVPRLAGRPVTGRRLGWVLFFVWNFLVVIPGWALVQAGISQPLEWGEFPIITDVFVVLAFVLMAAQFVLPFFRTRLADLYVAGWYIIGGIIFTGLAYPVGNFVPELVPGSRGATYSGLWIHDAVGTYATPFAVAVAYFVIPAATGKPIWSHFLSMLTFWMLFFIYPLNGTHHFVFSSIPMEAQVGAIVASIYLGMDVTLNVTNLLMSLRGSSGVVARDVPLRYVWLGVVLYLIVSLQGSLQAIMPVNRFIHFTDWVIAHAHLAMIGFASFMAIGGMLHVWKRTPGLRYNDRAATWSFWLLTVGLFLMVADLTAAGLVQAELWDSPAPWMDSVRASRTYWMLRSFAAIPLLAGFIALALSMLTGPLGEVSSVSVSDASQKGRETATLLRSVANRQMLWLQNAYVLTSVAGLGFFLLSFLVLAVWPNRTLEQQIAETRPPQLAPLGASELRGREIYGREGCVNCHSQLVRFTHADVRRFGLPSQAWETDREFPQLWGTRRIGPDLARESGRRSKDWQLTHLWNPRYVVPDSMMPGYSWLFDGSPRRPTKEALDLVTYLDFLGRDAQLAGLDQKSPPRLMDPDEEGRMGIFCDCAIPRTRGPAIFFSTDLPPFERDRNVLLGRAVFARDCAGCHGSAGKGDGPAVESLLPKPRDLTGARFSDRALSESLWLGVPGSSMPAWSDLPATELRGLACFVRSLESEESQETEKAQPSAERTKARDLFASNCITCHGDPESKRDRQPNSTLAPRATIFSRVRPSRAYAEAALRDGVPGTAMPPWKGKLTEDERRMLARYVRSLYDAEQASKE
ncbi:MAG TPA: cbb3-type cytochrome c oxidase subunit I [Gemmataceae bacterium]|nr:cbb3-type cytochrome c oxidase subunit I [Gemmataceae bacterium]